MGDRLNSSTIINTLLTSLNCNILSERGMVAFKLSVFLMKSFKTFVTSLPRHYNNSNYSALAMI